MQFRLFGRSRPVNIPLRGHKKLGQVTASILRDSPNMKVDCFENVIYLENNILAFGRISDKLKYKLKYAKIEQFS